MFSIARFVEDVRVASTVPMNVDLLPNGRTNLVIRVPEEGPGDVFVVGPRTRAKFKRTTGVSRAVTLRVKPGWAPMVFGVPASALTDQFVTLDELWGPSDLTADILAAPSVSAVLERLSRVVAARATFESSSARLARRAAHLFETTETRVDAVAEQLGVTARHLRRAFVDNVGIGPKEFARGVRLERAIRGTARSSDWSAIAREAGYYDQAHLSGEFRELTGITPSAFLQRRAA
jgi:AraC-like DNA-binding protein